MIYVVCAAVELFIPRGFSLINQRSAAFLHHRIVLSPLDFKQKDNQSQ